jgi:putative ABC transport system permease protein
MRRGLRRFLRLPRSATRIRADVDDELRFEIDMRTQALMCGGLDAATARERALAEFGDLEATRHYCEDLDMDVETAARRATLLSDLRADLSIAWRAMRRTPSFAVVVLTTFALGIGANTAVFSIVRRVLIAPLPYRDPGRLYRLYTAPAAADGDDDKLSAVEVAAFAAHSRSVAAVTFSGNYGSWTYTDGQTTEPWRMAAIAGNFLDVLGVRPVIGRGFIDDDLATGAPRVVLIGYACWQRVFGGDQGVIGRHIQLNSVDYRIVGVLPAAFVMPEARFGTADALQPLNVPAILRAARMSRSRAWRAIARLRDGASDGALAAELPVIRQRIQSQYSEIKNAGVIRPVPLHAAIVGSARNVLIAVMFGASLVLAITCINIAGLFLSRATSRRRELGLRAALGAGRARLVRQVLTESALYGIVGGAVGIALALAMKRAFLSLAGATLPQLGEIRIDASVLAFGATLSIACALAVGLVPAIAATAVDVREALENASGYAASQGKLAVRGTRALVAAQMALAVVLLVGAGLLVRTVVQLLRTDLGYRVDAQTLTFHVNLVGAQYRQAADVGALVGSFATRVHAIPGVTSVGHTVVAPWSGGFMNVGLRIEGRQPDDNDVPSIQYATASDEFFSAIGIPLRAGRVFSAADRFGGPPVLVISESVARRFWPGRSPIGVRVTLDDGAKDSSARPLEIVGVVGDIRPGVTAQPIGTVYGSENQWVGYGGEFVVRTTGDATAFIPAIKDALHALDPRLPLLFPRTIRQVLDESIARQELAMALMGSFAALALALAALGIYSVMAYMVVARTRELGIRAALGAGRATMLVMVLRRGLETTAVGVALGLCLAALGSRLVASLLVGVSSHDALTFAVAPLTLSLVAIAACLVPARAAMRADPVQVLRAD